MTFPLLFLLFIYLFILINKEAEKIKEKNLEHLLSFFLCSFYLLLQREKSTIEN